MMSIRNSLSSAVRSFARILLDTRNAPPVTQVQLLALQDLLSRQTFNQTPSDLQELVSTLRQKHIVDSISISQTNGALLASSSGNGASEVITASALFNYVQSEIPQSEVVLIRANTTWNMLFEYKGKIFIIKAPTNLTLIELRAISNEVEAFLAKKKETP